MYSDEDIIETHEEELYNWSEAFELSTFTEDTYDSVELFERCYENIVHLSILVA